MLLQITWVFSILLTHKHIPTFQHCLNQLFATIKSLFFNPQLFFISLYLEAEEKPEEKKQPCDAAWQGVAETIVSHSTSA